MAKALMIIVLLLASGCAANEKTNALIAQGNSTRFEAFTRGMSHAKSEGARIAIAMAFAGNMGTQSYFREDTVLDYMKGVASLVNPWIPYFFAYSGNQGEVTAGRDVYIESTRADTHSAYQSTTQDYFITTGGWAGSNDNGWDSSTEPIE